MNLKIVKKKKRKFKNFFQKQVLLIKYWVRKIIRMRSSPHDIALGFALGACSGIFPTFGFAIPIVTFLSLFIRMNLPAAILGTFLANPITGPFYLIIEYKIGKIISDYFFQAHNFFNLSPVNKKILDITQSIILGSIIFTMLCGIILYFITLFVVKNQHLFKKKPKTNF